MVLLLLLFVCLLFFEGEDLGFAEDYEDFGGRFGSLFYCSVGY